MIKRIEEQGVKRMVGYRGEDGATVNRSGSIWLIKLASSLRRGTSYVHGLCELTLLREWPRLILPSIPRLNTPSLNLSAREREIRRFARGWMTLVGRYFIPIVGRGKKYLFEEKNRGAKQRERDNMLLRTVSYSVSWQFGSGRVERRQETRMKFRLGDMRKGTMRWYEWIFLNIYCWLRIIVNYRVWKILVRLKNWRLIIKY